MKPSHQNVVHGVSAGESSRAFGESERASASTAVGALFPVNDAVTREAFGLDISSGERRTGLRPALRSPHLSSVRPPNAYDLAGQQRDLDAALASMGLGARRRSGQPGCYTHSAEHAALVQHHATTAREVEEKGNKGSQEQRLLDLASMMLEAAEEAAVASNGLEDRQEAEALNQGARAAIDLALDFTPGVGLAKDLVSITTRVNPITGHQVGDVEMGLIVAGIFVPGVVKGLSSACLKAGRRIGKRLSQQGRKGSLAGQLLAALSRARHFLESLGKAAADYTPEELRLLARGTEHSREAVDKSAKALRQLRGTAYISAPLPAGERFLRGSCANAGLVPRDVAAKLAGRDFSSFDALRRAFWKAVADSPHARGFDPSALADMRRGLAPGVAPSQWAGGQTVYHLHHITPVHRGGEVYDLANLMVTSPLFHSQVLDAAYHFGRRGGLS